MKRIFCYLVLTLFCGAVVAQTTDAKAVAGISFDKKEYDFGDVLRENRDYTCTFILENKGEKPLVLLSVNTSCSCLKANYSRRPLKTGQSSIITMTLEAGKMDVGVFHRVVEVHTNYGVGYITVRGNSIPK